MSQLCLDFPLRPDFLAQVVVPKDLTADEAKRLGAFIAALVTDQAALVEAAKERT